MRKELTFIVLVCLVLGFTLNAPLSDAEEGSEETHDISLFIFGEGGGSSPNMQSNPPGNFSTMSPKTTTDEYQIFQAQNSGIPEIYHWFSNPLKANFSIHGDVYFKIWALCNSPRYLGFGLSLQLFKSDGSGLGQGVFTSYKLVYNEPIEFNTLLSEETLDSNLKMFHNGDRIGISIMVDYYHIEPPAEVRILYNSTNHPSHMRINTSSISIDILNSRTSHKKASFDVEITDAFGVNDIAIHDVQVIEPSGEKKVDLEVIEDTNIDEGTIILHVSLDKSKDGNGNYTITITVKDINYNTWTKEEILELNFPENENEPSLTLYFLVLIAIGVIIVTIIYLFLSKKRK